LCAEPWRETAAWAGARQTSLSLTLAATTPSPSPPKRWRHGEELQRTTHQRTLQIERRRAAQREALKTASLRREQESFRELAASFNERNDRWLRKTQGSPFGNDLLAEAERTGDKVRAQERAARQRQRQALKAANELRAAQVARALTPTEEDELAKLRAEKRLLLEKEQQLRASWDVHRKVREVTPLRSVMELVRGVPPHLMGRTPSLPALL